MKYIARQTLCALSLIGATSAWAVPLATDPTAIPAFRGNAVFSNGTLISNVDYAVFAPGQYGAGDPSGGTQYVYAYQVFDAANSQRDVLNLTVGLQNASVAFNPTFDPTRGVLGGVPPSAQVIDSGSSSFISLWGAPTIAAGQMGAVVLMTSPVAPQFFSASVVGFGQQVNGMLPSPIPEPMSIAFFSMVGAAFFRRARK